jgi:hypothetical protein
MTCIEVHDGPAPTALGGQHDIQTPAKKPSLTLDTHAKQHSHGGEPADETARLPSAAEALTAAVLAHHVPCGSAPK